MEAMLNPGFDWPLRTLVVDLTVSIAGLLGGYAVMTKSIPMDDKRKAWVLSLFCSVGLVAGSIPYVFILAHNGGNTQVLFTDDRLSRFLVTYFASFLGLDLLVGRREYPKEVQMLTGYIHHAVYLLLCASALMGNFTRASTAMMPIELPTAFLALGHINKNLRSDLAFGVSFFVFRLVYFGYFAARMYFDGGRVPIWPLGIPIMALHVHWFSAWVSQQARLRKQSAAKAAKAFLKRRESGDEAFNIDVVDKHENNSYVKRRKTSIGA